MPDITIKSLDGKEFGAYAAPPKGGHGPGLIVIHEVFGVSAALRELCDAYASKGFLAVCPDLFWRQEPRVDLSDQNAADLDRALNLFRTFHVEASVRDLLATLAHVRRMPGCSGKVGAVGYCLGGKLAYLMASRSDVDCSVSYYGVGLEALLDEVHDIRMPLLLHVGERDKFVPAATRQKVLAMLARNPAISAFSYPGAEHAFARPQGQTYQAEAAAQANARTDAFLAENLQA
ncbi:MAG: dienelactone hydrolase family protein [Alphaproteobacteria bacterium]|nr:dienelactone hydrolase family protein [Alphaproteobacteria bacterium]